MSDDNGHFYISIITDGIQSVAGLLTAYLAYRANVTSKQALAVAKSTTVSEALISQLMEILPSAREVRNEHRTLFRTFQTGDLKRAAVAAWALKRESVSAALDVWSKVDLGLLPAKEAWREIEECEDSYLLDSNVLSCPEKMAIEKAIAQFEQKYQKFVSTTADALKSFRRL